MEMMITTKIRRCCLVVGLSSLLLAGCGGSDEKEEGPTGNVEGTVTMDGEPFTEGSVSFYNPDTGESGGGELGADGKFKLDSPIPVGKYQVSFLPPEPPQPDDEASAKKADELSKLIPEAYQDGNTSGFAEDVKEGPNSFEFKLSKTGPGKTDGGETPP